MEDNFKEERKIEEIPHKNGLFGALSLILSVIGVTSIIFFLIKEIRSLIFISIICEVFAIVFGIIGERMHHKFSLGGKIIGTFSLVPIICFGSFFLFFAIIDAL